jgi:hypothetical protein
VSHHVRLNRIYTLLRCSSLSPRVEGTRPATSSRARRSRFRSTARRDEPAFAAPGDFVEVSVDPAGAIPHRPG